MLESLASCSLRTLSDLNFSEFLREHARWCEGGAIDERDGALRTLAATRYPAGMVNSAICTGEPPRDPAAWLARQRRYFAEAGRGFSVYTRGELDGALAEACVDAGLTALGAAPGMVREEPIPEPADAPLSFESLDAPASLTAWVELQANAYATLGLPEAITREVMKSPERMLAPHSLFMLGHRDGAPAVGAMVLFSHGIAGLYWVGVPAAQRRRGLGEAITRAITNAAFARGARAVVLQASPMGQPIYEALGFRVITSYPRFLSPRDRPS